MVALGKKLFASYALFTKIEELAVAYVKTLLLYTIWSVCNQKIIKSLEAVKKIKIKNKKVIQTFSVISSRYIFPSTFYRNGCFIGIQN